MKIFPIYTFVHKKLAFAFWVISSSLSVLNLLKWEIMSYKSCPSLHRTSNRNGCFASHLLKIKTRERNRQRMRERETENRNLKLLSPDQTEVERKGARGVGNYTLVNFVRTPKQKKRCYSRE